MPNMCVTACFLVFNQIRYEHSHHQKALKTLSFQGFLLFLFRCHMAFRGCTTYGGASADFLIKQTTVNYFPLFFGITVTLFEVGAEAFPSLS